MLPIFIWAGSSNKPRVTQCCTDSEEDALEGHFRPFPTQVVSHNLTGAASSWHRRRPFARQRKPCWTVLHNIWDKLVRVAKWRAMGPALKFGQSEDRYAWFALDTGCCFVRSVNVPPIPFFRQLRTSGESATLFLCTLLYRSCAYFLELFACVLSLLCSNARPRLKRVYFPRGIHVRGSGLTEAFQQVPVA